MFGFVARSREVVSRRDENVGQPETEGLGGGSRETFSEPSASLMANSLQRLQNARDPSAD